MASIKILICLGNHLLGQALAGLVRQIDQNLEVVVFEEGRPPGPFLPDLVLFDSHHCEDEFFARWPAAKFILIDTGLESRDLNCLIVSHGIDGIIAQDMDTQFLKKAIYAVRSGEIWINQKYIRLALRGTGVKTGLDQFRSLSEQDKKIVGLVADGCKNREIAQKLHLSEQTVKAHVSKIFRIMNVSSRSQLINLALKHHIGET